MLIFSIKLNNSIEPSNLHHIGLFNFGVTDRTPENIFFVQGHLFEDTDLTAYVLAETQHHRNVNLEIVIFMAD